MIFEITFDLKILWKFFPSMSSCSERFVDHYHQSSHTSKLLSAISGWDGRGKKGESEKRREEYIRLLTVVQHDNLFSFLIPCIYTYHFLLSMIDDWHEITFQSLTDRQIRTLKKAIRIIILVFHFLVKLLFWWHGNLEINGISSSLVKFPLSDRFPVWFALTFESEKWLWNDLQKPFTNLFFLL